MLLRRRASKGIRSSGNRRRRSELVDFRVTAFVAYITKHALSEKENDILRLLANYSPLPLSVVGEFTGIAPQEVSKATMRLIDFSMAYPDRDGCYAIAEPLKDAAFKRSAYFKKAETRKVASLLDNWITDNPAEIVSLRLSRVVFRVASQAGNAALANKAVHIAADTFRLAQEAYNQQDYETAVEWFRKVLALRPGHDRSNELLVRSLAQLEEWEECETLCAALERKSLPVRTTAFLRGFVERKHNNIPSAITQFELARSAKRADVALLRELAWCYFIRETVRRPKGYSKRRSNFSRIIPILLTWLSVSPSSSRILPPPSNSLNVFVSMSQTHSTGIEWLRSTQEQGICQRLLKRAFGLCQM